LYRGINTNSIAAKSAAIWICNKALDPIAANLAAISEHWDRIPNKKESSLFFRQKKHPSNLYLHRLDTQEFWVLVDFICIVEQNNSLQHNYNISTER
jgi:hypothetical protein